MKIETKTDERGRGTIWRIELRVEILNAYFSILKVFYIVPFDEFECLKPFSGDQSVQLKNSNGNGKGNEKCASHL